jgi:hypothetical protein
MCRAALALSGRSLAVESFTGQRAFVDATNELIAITLVQSWPTLGASTLPLADLRALLAR